MKNWGEGLMKEVEEGDGNKWEGKRLHFGRWVHDAVCRCLTCALEACRVRLTNVTSIKIFEWQRNMQI